MATKRIKYLVQKYNFITSINCGDGWYDLIDMMGYLIQNNKTYVSIKDQIDISTVNGSLTIKYIGDNWFISRVIHNTLTLSSEVCPATGNIIR